MRASCHATRQRTAYIGSDYEDLEDYPKFAGFGI